MSESDCFNSSLREEDSKGDYSQDNIYAYDCEEN